MHPNKPYTVSYAVAGLEQIPDSSHNTKQEAMSAARQFIQSYNTSKSKNAGEYMEGFPGGYLLKHIGGGTVAVARVSGANVWETFNRLVKECVEEVLRENLLEGFDPTSQGPNPAEENPYPRWNSEMRKLEETDAVNEARPAAIEVDWVCVFCHKEIVIPVEVESPSDYMASVECEFCGKSLDHPALDEKIMRAVTDYFVGRAEYMRDTRDDMRESLDLTPTGGEDYWSRPVYRDQNGKIYVDINLGKGTPSIHSVTDEGEPDMPIKNFKLVGNNKKSPPTPLGKVDKFSRPLYKDQDGNILVDINSGKGTRPILHPWTDDGSLK